jgi:glutathione S-transferase
VGQLRRGHVDYSEVRLPHRKRERAEVQALSGQDRVPLLVIEREAICDSKRIVEHLEYRVTERST